MRARVAVRRTLLVGLAAFGSGLLASCFKVELRVFDAEGRREEEELGVVDEQVTIG